MPNGWKKNAKYIDTSKSHNEYCKLKNEFRQWKKMMDLKDNYAPYKATRISDNKWVPPTDYLNVYNVCYESRLSKSDHIYWCLYLKCWIQKLSNQTYRHRGCRPNCKVYKPNYHGRGLEGDRKFRSKQINIDFKINTIKHNI